MRQQAEEALQAKEEVGGCLVLSSACGWPGCSPAARLTPGVGVPLVWERPMGKSTVGTVSLQASGQLEENAVALRDAEAQLEQLTVANSRLSTGRGG